MKFEGQHPDEQIIFILRKHPTILFRSAIFLTLFTFLPIFALIFFKFSWVFSYSFFLWLIVAGTYGFRVLYIYKNSRYILTNTRLISMEQKGIFHKTASETPLEKIQDVSFEIKGFWPSMWDYGTIYVQTAGFTRRFALEFVDEPSKIKDQIAAELGITKGVLQKPSKKSNFWN